VEGILAAAEHPDGYQVYNLGFGHPVSLAEMVTTLEDVMGKRVRARFSDAPPTEPPYLGADITRAQEALGYEPKVGLREGLERTWAWYKAEVLEQVA
jgi:nucleoside-diphosphate-sugar epimerase